MLKQLRALLERFWLWLAGEPLPIEASIASKPGPGQLLYTVQPGDTLRSIARQFGTSVWILADLNQLDDVSRVRAGQRLLIPRRSVPMVAAAPQRQAAAELPHEAEPGPFIYIVRAGDTLDTVVHQFGVTAAALIEANHLGDLGRIRPGQRLLIPGPQANAESESGLLTPSVPPFIASPPAPSPAPSSESVAPAPLPITTSISSPEPGSSAYGAVSEAASTMPLGATPQITPEASSRQYIYMVRPGDTLLAIARRFNVTVRAIIEANEMDDPSLIKPGQGLVIPGLSMPLTLAATPESGLEHLITAPSPSDTSQLPIAWPGGALRAIYVSYFALGRPEQRRRVIDMLSRTEINALVIDVKSDHGLISYPTDVRMAPTVGAAQPTADDFDELMDFFKANRVYTIGRIVTFRDHAFARAHAEWAAHQKRGDVWHDREKLAWTDPFARAVWEYNADLAEEAARRGFDEIQFDQVRFPTSSQDGAPHFSQPLDFETRTTAIVSFLSYVRGRLAPLRVRVAANVFGYTCWRTDDAFIGQNIEHMAPYLDVLCPMLYPSTFGSGIPGYRQAVAHPYEIVFESMKRALSKVKPWNCQVRPWIQDFADFRFDKRSYGLAEIRAQIRASFDAGGAGYMAWDPRTEYTLEAYLPESPKHR